jgi:hypothetical protein
MILVLIMTLSLAGLAMSAIYMATSSGLLSRYHDKERDLVFAVETALELGKSRLQRDTTLILYDTGYTQLLTSQAVYDASGNTLTGVTVNLYGGYTGDTTGLYVPYVTLLATVSDASGIRLARRMDLYSQSFSRYGLFANDFPASANIGAGETVTGRVHANNRFIAASSGSPYPVFLDTVSAAGTISGNGQWSDTVSSTGGSRVIPFPSATAAYWGATNMRVYFNTLATAGSLNATINTVASTSRAWSGVDVSGLSGGTATTGGRIEFVTVDVNNNGMIDSTEGFMRVFNLDNSCWEGCTDTVRLATNFTGTPIALSSHILLNQCGAFYTISGKREFFPIAMHKVSWVQTRIQSSTYPTVSAAQAATMAALDRTAIRTIVQQPTARCYPAGSPYLMNVERHTTNTSCTQDWWTAVTKYTWGSGGACTAAQRYGGQDTTFTQYPFTCQLDQTVTTGRCTYEPAWVGEWEYFPGTSSLPSLPTAVRQDMERQFLWPLHPTYNAASRRVVYVNRRVYVSGTVRGNVTIYVNGNVSLVDDLVYDSDPADASNLCRNFLGLIARDSIQVSDNVINRPRAFDTPATTADYTLTLGGNRDYLFQGIALSLGGSFNVINPSAAIVTNPVYTCPTGSAFTASGGCLHVVGGVVEKTYVAPYASGTAGSGLRPLREADPCQATNRRPPYFPLARSLVRPYKTFDVDVRQVKTAALLTSYFRRLRGAKPAP